ncbi:hypothetical protein HUJ04_010320 [Dendroctonus ponderosae]|nr:hypothetical protein HUJ04_010320 [Dendroctonus ponderosae]
MDLKNCGERLSYGDRSSIEISVLSSHANKTIIIKLHLNPCTKKLMSLKLVAVPQQLIGNCPSFLCLHSDARRNCFCLSDNLLAPFSKPDGGVCKTPLGTSGVCISIFECSPIIALLKAPSRTNEQIQFIISSKEQKCKSRETVLDSDTDSLDEEELINYFGVESYIFSNIPDHFGSIEKDTLNLYDPRQMSEMIIVLVHQRPIRSRHLSFTGNLAIGHVPPRFELGSLDSKSRVLTITPWNRHKEIAGKVGNQQMLGKRDEANPSSSER